MSLFRRQDDEARQALDSAIASLRDCQRHGVHEVAVGEVLQFLGADPEAAPAPLAQYRDPAADPLTGCKPVTAARP